MHLAILVQMAIAHDPTLGQFRALQKDWGHRTASVACARKMGRCCAASQVAALRSKKVANGEASMMNSKGAGAVPREE